MWSVWKISQISVVCAIAFFRFYTDGYWGRCETETEKDDLDRYRSLGGNHVFMEANRFTTPYHVALVATPQKSSFVWCGGSIISRKYILTAAHCLEGSNTTTVALYKSTNDNNNLEHTLESNVIIRHPKWQPRFLLNDLALVELPRPLHLPDLSPIEISPGAKIASTLTTVYGWGRNSANQPILSANEVVVIKNKVCARHYGSLINKFKICTEGRGSGDVCRGFSGAGLVVDGLLVGVMSFGADRCEDGYPTVYTRVWRYRKWIEEVLGT